MPAKEGKVKAKKRDIPFEDGEATKGGFLDGLAACVEGICGGGPAPPKPASAPKPAAAPAGAPGAQPTVHMLMCTLDYTGTSAPLTASQDGKNILDLVKKCGIENVTYMKDKQCHLSAVKEAITTVCKRCEEGDYFVFFYAGHGVQIKDQDGDEEDGMDEALALVTPAGKIDFKYFLRDDDFAELIAKHTKKGVNILILCDCCHSGTIGDFDRRCWAGHTALSMSGCRDSQTAGDTGKGGIWTHTCLIAVQEMSEAGKKEWNCQDFHELQLKRDDQVFNSEQDLRMYCTQGLTKLGGAKRMNWPLVPKTAYLAPWNNWKKYAYWKRAVMSRFVS